jgi:cytochrome c553
MKNFQKEPMPKKKSHPIADQFSDDEMDQIKHYGQALGGSPTPFDEKVEKTPKKIRG